MESQWHTLYSLLKTAIDTFTTVDQNTVSAFPQMDADPSYQSELIQELSKLVEQLRLSCYSTYHTCAAIAEIASAGLGSDYPGNPYLSSIYALATKEDSHAAEVSDLLATCEQLFHEFHDNDANGDSVTTTIDCASASTHLLRLLRYHLRRSVEYVECIVRQESSSAPSKHCTVCVQ